MFVDTPELADQNPTYILLLEQPISLEREFVFHGIITVKQKFRVTKFLLIRF